MSLLRKIQGWMPRLRVGTRSLRSTLSIYFIPISVLPALLISFYAISIFEENTLQTLKSRAASEREALIAEVRSKEESLQTQGKKLAQSDALANASSKTGPVPLNKAFGETSEGFSWRFFNLKGELVASRLSPADKRVSYLSQESLSQLKKRNETLERFFSPDGNGIVTLSRLKVRKGAKVLGILEGQYRLGQQELAELRNRKQIDVVFLNRDLSAGAASFALSGDALKKFSRLPFTPGGGEPSYVSLGENRFSVFLYDLPAPLSKKPWGYFALFLSMAGTDATLQKLKAAIVSVTTLLGFLSALLIFIFSNRIVQPVELLVVAMKRLKTGKGENMPPIDSAYEIEYLVQSFNEMTRNVVEAREALEQKVEELGQANDEIRSAQSALIQNAKMISLGQIVAGVAHELNNPIGFIYSNMHHLSTYVEKIQQWRDAYQKHRSLLPEASQKELDELDRKLEMDFILKDMVELTKSCVDGANRTREIVLGLRTFSRTESSTFGFVDLHEGLRSTLKLLASELRDRIHVHEEFDEIPHVECNLSQLNQVFMNLISNASHAVAHRGDIWVRTKKLGRDRVIIQIEDNGGGMSPEVMEKIFDPFFTTKKVGTGTGLGLSIAYGLIQKHNGQIKVESQIGKGTLFTITLPITQPKSLPGQNQA